MIVPGLAHNTRGQSYHPDETKYPFESVYVANNFTDTAATINAKLAEGLHLVLQPGFYNLTEPLKVIKDNQVVLGLGFATLNSGGNNTCIEVANVDGVRIAGVLL